MLGLAACMTSLTGLATAGFALVGRLTLLVLIGFATGLACILLTGRDLPQAARRE